MGRNKTHHRETPFLIAIKLRPRLVRWKPEGDVEIVEAEHLVIQTWPSLLYIGAACASTNLTILVN